MLPKYNYLNLSDNKSTGKLPEIISPSFTNLTIVHLSHNVISGNIPVGSLLKLPGSLRQLDLSRNNITGKYSSYDFGTYGGIH